MTIFLILLGVVLAIFMLTVIVGAPFVPSHKSDINDAFDNLRYLGENDVFLDLGGGDGAVCLEACKRGSAAINFEINPILASISLVRLRKFRDKYSVKIANYLQVEIPKNVSVIYVFSESRHILGIYNRIQAESNRQATAFDVISYGFEIPGVKFDNRSSTHFLYKIQPLLN